MMVRQHVTIRNHGYVLITVILVLTVMSALVECLARQVSMEYQIVNNLQVALYPPQPTSLQKH